MKGLCSKAYDTARLCGTRCEERELRRKAKLELKDFFFFFFLRKNKMKMILKEQLFLSKPLV